MWAHSCIQAMLADIKYVTATIGTKNNDFQEVSQNQSQIYFSAFHSAHNFKATSQKVILLCL